MAAYNEEDDFVDEGFESLDLWERESWKRATFTEEQERKIVEWLQAQYTINKGEVVRLPGAGGVNFPKGKRVNYGLPVICLDDGGFEDFLDGGRIFNVSRKEREEFDKEDREFRQKLLEGRWEEIKPSEENRNPLNQDHMLPAYLVIKKQEDDQINFVDDTQGRFKFIIVKENSDYICLQGPLEVSGYFKDDSDENWYLLDHPLLDQELEVAFSQTVMDRRLLRFQVE